MSGLALLASFVCATAVNAQSAAPAAAPTVSNAQSGILIGAGSEPAKTLTAEDVARLPAVSVPVSFATDHGTRQATFEGPLLWTVLTQAGAVDPAHPQGQVRQTVTVTGRDGYTAILAIGEVSPEFEAKQVILADRMDNAPLGPEHLRLVVPGEKRGGRSVRDVVRITVGAPATSPH